MTKSMKILVGLLLIVLLTYGRFYVQGYGERTINLMTAQSNQALANAGIIGVTVAFEANPIRRVAHLTGEGLTPEQEARAIAIVKREPGVAEAVWDRVGDPPAFPAFKEG